MYTQDRDSYDYQTNARNYLRDAFKKVTMGTGPAAF